MDEEEGVRVKKAELAQKVKRLNGEVETNQD
jgi:hypothetical protein